MREPCGARRCVGLTVPPETRRLHLTPPHHSATAKSISKRKKSCQSSPNFQGQICKACLDTFSSSEAWWCIPYTPGSHSQALTCSTHFTDRELRPESTLASPLSSPIRPEASHPQDTGWLPCPRCCHTPKPLACQRSFQIPSSSIFHKTSQVLSPTIQQNHELAKP